MKTNLYFLFFLFALSSMVNGQTDDSKSNKQILTELDKKPAANNDKKSSTINATKTATVAKAPSSTFNLKANTDSMNQLMKKSEELNAMSTKMRNDSKGKKDDVKKLLLSEASNLDKQSQTLQVAASELSGKISNYKFNQNKTNINNYVAKAGEDNVPVYTKNLIFDSEKVMRLAHEMREEANAQPNLASKLGTMGNAEEQESLALSKQVEALTQLERASQNAMSSH